MCEPTASPPHSTVSGALVWRPCDGVVRPNSGGRPGGESSSYEWRPQIVVPAYATALCPTTIFNALGTMVSVVAVPSG